MVRKGFWAAGCSVYSGNIAFGEGGGFHKDSATVREERPCQSPEEARAVAFNLNLTHNADLVKTW